MARIPTEDRLARHRGRLAAYEHAICVLASRLDVNGDVSQEIRDGISIRIPQAKPLAREVYAGCLTRMADNIERAGREAAG